VSHWHPTSIKLLKKDMGQVWWCAPIIPALGRQRQEDSKFKASLGGQKSETFRQKRYGMKLRGKVCLACMK
jgi:hypothetical protein